MNNRKVVWWKWRIEFFRSNNQKENNLTFCETSQFNIIFLFDFQDDSIYALIAAVSLQNRDFDSAENAFAQLSNVKIYRIFVDIRFFVLFFYRPKWFFVFKIFVQSDQKKNVKLNLRFLLEEIFTKQKDIIFKEINLCTRLCCIWTNTIGIGKWWVFDSIDLIVHRFESRRAIDLTQRHPQYLEIVVGYRQKYLKDYGGGKKETNPKFLQAMKNVRWGKKNHEENRLFLSRLGRCRLGSNRSKIT